MAQTTTAPRSKAKSSTAAKKPAATRKRSAAPKKSTATRRRAAAKGRRVRLQSRVDNATGLSTDVLKSIEDGQRAAIEAVEKFVDTVDKALPLGSNGASRRRKVVDSALEMADQLVHTEYKFLREVVNSAGKSLSEADRAKTKK